MRIQLAALGCVVLIALGQIAFKAAAEASVSAGATLAPRPVAIAIGAFAIYGIASILWMLLLQRAPISRVYPFMGLAFLIVPVIAHFTLGDTLSVRNMVGSAIIALGIVIAVSA